MNRYFLPIFLALILLNGCQTQKTLPSAFYQPSVEPVFPAIDFYGMKPSAALTELCNRGRCYPNAQHLDGIYAQLQSSKMFRSVSGRSNAHNEYSVHAVVRQFSMGNVATDIAKGALTGATLLLVPSTESREYRSEFVVAWRGIKIAEYSFVTPFEYRMSLYDTPAKQDAEVSEKIVAEFLSSAQGDNVFSSERIYSVLKAEDYHRDLKSPVQVGDYRHRDFYLYPDPRVGVQLRYENQKFAKQVVDVFVYPIRELDWSDSGRVAQNEINIALKDVELAVKGGAYKSAQFEIPKMISIGEKVSINRGWLSKGRVVWSDGKISTDYLYVFVMKDKYLKFRVSFPENQVDDQSLNNFVSGVLKDIVVPDESYFMASLRQQQRSSMLK